MKTNVSPLGWWPRLKSRFQRTVPPNPDKHLRSDVEACITLLKTSHRRTTPLELPSAASEAAHCNGFGLRLLDRLARPQTENVFFSPCGIALALNMMLNGAQGETRQAMERVLGLKSADVETLNGDSANLMKALAVQTEHTQVYIANSLWLMHPERVEAEFLQCGQNHYRADIERLEAGTKGAETINAWVREQTQGTIGQIVENVPTDIHAILANVVYFHSRWETPFRSEVTREWPFTPPNRRKISCQMMFQEDNYLYLRTNAFRAARIPYQDGFHMTVLLPHPDVPFQEMLDLLTPENWAQVRHRFRAVAGRIGLPRFRFHCLTQLKETLTQLGMGIAFDSYLADFAAMSPDFCLGQIVHQAWVEVHEEGTTATATTVVEALYTGLGIEEPEDRFTLILDRPFCCAIEDEQTGALLFLGAIMSP